MKSQKFYKNLFSKKNWNYDTIKYADELCNHIAKKYLKLDTYENQIEIITSEQMLDAYALIGLPTSYPHWRFGKHFVANHSAYHKGKMGLAYEMVINSNPCISYNMENNSTTMMVLVIAHAAYGHNSFFKNNYMFKDWTDADSIIDYMSFARNFVIKCEDEFGEEEVEETLDACHALMDHAVDMYKKPKPHSQEKEKERLKQFVENKRKEFSELWKTIPDYELKFKKRDITSFPVEPEENLLYFIEKNAPKLPEWKRELVRIVRKTAQYFYPQGQTKVMNEGWATFTHYNIIQKMNELGYVDDGFMLEFYHKHSNVMYQPPYNSDYYSGLNPYTLGYNMFTDLKRICENPTQEDKEWFKDIAGSNWTDTLHYIMNNFRDDSFVLQWLSPKVIRDMKLFTVEDREKSKFYKINNIHDEAGYQNIREVLSEQYSRSNRIPRIQITKVDRYKDRRLHMVHYINNNKKLDQNNVYETLYHIKKLWEFPVQLVSVNDMGKIAKRYKLD